MFLKGKICPCGFVGIEEGQAVAEDATHQIQCSLCRVQRAEAHCLWGRSLPTGFVVMFFVLTGGILPPLRVSQPFCFSPC